MSLPAQAPPAPSPPLILRYVDEVPVLEIPPDLPYEALRDWLDETLPPRLEEIGGRIGRLDLAERELHLFDLRRLVHHLLDQHGLEISGVYVRPEAVHRYAERDLKLVIFQTPAPPPEDPVEDRVEDDRVEGRVEEADEDLGHSLEEAPDLLEPLIEGEIIEAEEVIDLGPELTPVHDDEEPSHRPSLSLERTDPSRRTLSLHRTLRSGASVRFDGDVLIFGDVNPGAQVIAAGNVVVLGALKGMGHAGATGAEDAFIFAFELRPTQLRIGRKIAIPPEEDARPEEPEFARLVEDQIVIDPYRVRSPR